MAGISTYAARIGERFRLWWQHQAVAGILLTVCAAIVLAALGFGAYSGYLGLRTVLAPWAAALAMAGVLLLLALVAAIVANAYSKRPVHTPRRAEPDLENRIPVEIASRMGRDLGRNLGRRGVRVSDIAIAAMIAGVALGAAPALRERFGQDSCRDGESAGRRRR